MTAPKMTIPTQLVLRALLNSPPETYGAQLMEASAVASGTLYPILRRLEGAGWVTSRWEDRPTSSHTPAKRFYTLTAAGRAKAESVGPVRWSAA